MGPARRPRPICRRPEGAGTPAPWLRLLPPPLWRRLGSFILRPACQTPAFSFKRPPPPACRTPPPRPRPPSRFAGKRGARRGGRLGRGGTARAHLRSPCPRPGPSPPASRRSPNPARSPPAAGRASGAAAPAASPRALRPVSSASPGRRRSHAGRLRDDSARRPFEAGVGVQPPAPRPAPPRRCPSTLEPQPRSRLI